MAAAAAHVEQSRLMVAEAETSQSVEERLEEPRALRGETRGREALRIVELIRLLKLRTRRLHGRQRAPAALAPAITPAAIDELAGASGPSAGRTGGRTALHRLDTRRGLVSPPVDDAPQRLLEVGGGARPRVVLLRVRAAGRAKALVALRIARPVVEEALEAGGQHLGRRAAEDQGRRERPEDLRRRADGRPEHGRTAGERLHGDEPEAFELAGGKHEGVGRLVVARERLVGHEAQELHVRLEAQRAALRL